MIDDHRLTEDELQLSSKTCAACGLPEITRRDPLCGDGSRSEAMIHLRCYNSPEAHIWRERECASDPEYASLRRWMVAREPITCLHCGVALEMSAKAIGMGAGSWTLNCTTCHRTGPRTLSGYGNSRDAYTAVEKVRHDFVRSLNLDQTEARMRDLARRYDHLTINNPCECGGRFSIAANPRCPYCNEVAIDSYFHWVAEPLSEERQKRLDELFNRAAVMPKDWDDPAGWERYYANVSAAAASDNASYVGDMDAHRLPKLIRDLREQGCRSIWFPGCGVSPLPRLFADFGFSVQATDISETAIRLQKGEHRILDSLCSAVEKNVRRLKEQMLKVDPALGGSTGSFDASVQDFRSPFLRDAFDMIINANSFHGFSGSSSKQIAATHFAALRPSGQAIFDLINVQGWLRDDIENCLVGTGFRVPMLNLNRRLRGELEASRIPHVFVFDRPVIPRLGSYLDPEKRRRDTKVLREIFGRFESRRGHEQEAERRRIFPDAKVATVVYSSGWGYVRAVVYPDDSHHAYPISR